MSQVHPLGLDCYSDLLGGWPRPAKTVPQPQPTPSMGIDCYSDPKGGWPRPATPAQKPEKK